VSHADFLLNQFADAQVVEVGFPNRTGRIELRDVVFDLEKPCTAAVVSLSGEPIREARRLLIATVGDSVNASLDLSVSTGEAQLLLSGDTNVVSQFECDRNGRPPVLVQPIPGRITLKGRSGKVIALGSDGGPTGEAPAAMTADGLVLTLGGRAYLLEVRSE